MDRRTTRAVTVDGEKLLDALDNIITGFQVIRAAVARAKTSTPEATMGVLATQRPADASPSRPATTPAAPSNGALSAGPLAILEAIAWHGAADDDVIAIATGYKETSRRTYIGALLSRRLVERDGKRFRPTPEGLEALGPAMDRKRKPSPTELLDGWLERLGEGESSLLAAIAAAGYPVTMPFLIERTGYKETSVRTYLGELARRRLIVRASGLAKLHPELGGPR